MKQEFSRTIQVVVQKGNKMLKEGFTLLSFLASTTSFANDLDFALNAVKSQQQQYNNEQEAIRLDLQRQENMRAEKAAAQAKAERAAAEAKAEKAAAEARAQHKAAKAKAEAEANAKRQAIDADKKRDQAYEDELRKMDLEERRIALEEKKAKAARANDYIDAELGRHKAETDVVKSAADAKRNVSEGTKEMLIGVGKGAEADGKNWFK
ncbi:DUF5384 family protein [Nitrosomonas sp. Nm34]|uniref:DUF5384 family protein n=1 Tax=Nitrosomonas sp. Nm34 TaxID=1881055 RepID=UPI0008EAA7B7|nr:DUF5384 family protein [Nitrosomonas sp. Nm34]SFI39753.1 hypothetical protein SAMN05428978_100862 [Nitrosomonas sp. Nm34]